VKNELGVFFDHIDEALRTDIIVTLHALFDERRSKRRGNWIDYLEKTKKYLPGIMGQSVSPARLESLREEISLQIGSIRVMKPVIDSIKFARDKKYAHFDEKYFDKPEALVTDKPLPFRDVVSLVDLCKGILNDHEAKVFDCPISDWAEDYGKQNLKAVFGYVRGYHKLCDEVRKRRGPSELLEMI